MIVWEGPTESDCDLNHTKGNSDTHNKCHDYWSRGLGGVYKTTDVYYIQINIRCY